MKNQRLQNLLKAVGGFFKGIWVRIRNRIKGQNKEGNQPEGKFHPMGRFWFYLLLIVFAVIFTQALRSTVSSVILIFLVLLPITSLLYLLLSILTLKVYLDSDGTEVEKMREVDFSLILANESPLPFPFVEAMISVPEDDALRCVRELTRLSLIPFGRYEIRKKLAFAYRGGYTIGVSDIYVYDLFRLFRLRLDVNLFREIFVMPRRLSLSAKVGSEAVSEQTETVNRYAGTDNTEMTDIRDYRIGDSLRSIHWKLSSKTEELQVRQYARNSERQAIIFCDTGRRFPIGDERFTDDVGEFVADGIIETAIALTLYTLEQHSGSVTLVWFDSRSETGIFGIRLESDADFDSIYRTFATAPITDTAESPGDLAALVASGSDQVTYRFVTGCVDHALAASLSTLTMRGSVTAELYTYLPIEKVMPSAKKDYFDELNAAQSAIARTGIRILDARDTDLFSAEKSSSFAKSDEKEEA
ncbi:MAG: DUF58 domain-containing protein [Eubacteriales bacterium]